MLIPERKVNVKAAPVYGNFKASCDWILATDSIEDNVDATLLNKRIFNRNYKVV